MKKKIYTIHPFLFALFPIVFLIAHNAGQVLIAETFLPVIVVLLTTAVFYKTLKMFLKRNGQKAGLITSILLLVFFTYGSVYTCLNQFVLLRHRVLLPTVFGLVAACMIWIVKTKRNLTMVTELLNSTAVTVVMLSFCSIIWYHSQLFMSTHGKPMVQHSPIDVSDTPRVDPLPDIYYIILDGYVSAQTSKEVFGFDNQHLLSFLEEKGFYVARRSKANYHMTFLSLAASLNMRYVDYSYRNKRIDNNDFLEPFHLIRDNAVMRFLKAQGYTIVISGNWWGPTARNKYADITFNKYGYINEFIMTLMHDTILNLIADPFKAHITRKMILHNFEVLEKIPEIDTPTFSFLHIMAPHSPYIFGPKGEHKNIDLNTLSDPEVEKKHYFEQFLFVTKKIEEAVATILRKSEHTPIIIIQSDHGWPFDSVFKRRVIQRMRIFNAYLLPEGGDKYLYELISPVNSFRLIFKHYFHAKLELLEDRNYYSTRLYDYTDFLNFSDTETTLHD